LPDAPFLGAGSTTTKFVRPTDLFAESAATKEDGVLPGLGALLHEVLRVERHGFTATELEREKKEYLRGFQQAVIERDKVDARQFANEIVRHFLQGESMPGIEAERAMVERFLPTLTLAELNGLAKSWGGTANRVIAINGPPKMARPTPEAVLALVQSVQGRKVDAYEDAVSNAPLMATPPHPGTVTATRTIAAIGVTEWKLSNGIRVVLKPTDFKNDEVRVSAFSPGGHSLAKDADFDSARFAAGIVNEAGVGPFGAVQLRKALSGKIVAVHPEIDELSEGLSGAASPEDLETLLQLIHLEITAPRRDEASFRAWKARETEQVRNRRLDPEASFSEDLQTFVAQNHRRRRPITPELLAGVDLDRALAAFRDRFADVGDFTFVFVGNVEPERLKPLVETYLGSLPSKGRKETWRDVGVNPPAGVKTMTVAKGTEPKAQVVLLFHGNETWTRDNANDMQMLEEVLGIRLREVLREDLGGVYGVGANGWLIRRPRQKFGFVVQFGCAPDNVDKLKQAVFTEIKALQDKGIGDDYLKKVKETRLRSHEVGLKENGFWLRELRQAWDFGDDPLLIPDIKPMVAKVTSQRVRAAAKRYLRSTDYVTGVLKPQGPTSQAP
jgi:zinc protease